MLMYSSPLQAHGKANCTLQLREETCCSREGGIWQDWFRLRQCWESVCGHVSPPKSSCVDSRVLPQPAQRLVSIALQ